MERLTNTGTNGEIWITDNDETRKIGQKEAAYKKLKAYEDSEEQGRLVKLPCKVGDAVYAIGFNNNKPIIYESVVLRILITEKEIVFNVKVDEFGINSQLKQSMFGKTVFLTKSEAEKKLKEMENKNDEKTM